MTEYNSYTLDHIREEKTKRLVKHYFSDEEKQTFGEELANAHAERNAAQNDLDTVKKQIGARVTEQDGIIVERVQKIRSGYEMRREPCTVVKNFTTCSVVVTRDSTGEILEERTMTSEEAQIPLFGQEEQEVDAEFVGDETEEAATTDAKEEAETTGDEEQEEIEPPFAAGKTYNVVTQGPKRKKTHKNLTYEETKTDVDSDRIGHVFKDLNGRMQVIEHDHIMDVEVVENAA